MQDQSTPNTDDPRVDEILAAYHAEADKHSDLKRAELLRRYPEHAVALAEYFADQDALGEMAQPLREKLAAVASTQTYQRRSLAETEDHVERPGGQTEAAGNQNFTPGTIFANQFRVLSVHGGGMGEVCVAQDLSALRRNVDLKVAIKTVRNFQVWQKRRNEKGARAERSDYGILLQRFRREAEYWVRLGNHDNIIWAFYVLEVGEQPYLVMEYADQGDLQHWITDQKLTVSLAVDFAMQICSGMLHAVQSGNVVHRDLKPSNVLISRGRLAKIADFGLAKAFDEPTGESPDDEHPKQGTDLSMAGGGTLPYMPPEQFFRLSDADTRSDIFAFGAMFFEMLTSRRLYASRDAHTHLSLRRQSPPEAHEVNSAVPPQLSAMIARCVAYFPEDRYQSFAELRDDLSEFRDVKSVVAVPANSGIEFTPEAHAHAETYSLISLGEYSKAIARADEALQQYPRSYQLWINKGNALTQLRQFQQAQTCFLRAASIRSDDARTWASLSVIYLETGRVELAVDTAERAVSLDRESYDAHFARGRAMEAAGDLESAEQAYLRAAEIQPHQWTAHFLLGACRFRRQQHSDALDSLRTASEINPGSAMIWSTMTLCLAELGRWDEALAASHKSLELHSDDDVSWTIRGRLLWDGRHDTAGAKTCWTKALKLNPENNDARSLLAGVQ